MEAARRFDRSSPAAELARLRPFGEAYLMRNFGEQLAHADAEDAVSEVTLRLHRQIDAGRSPDNLQAAFLTGARNAAIDRLRRRTRKPTVEIEAAAEAATELPAPDELAERREASARIREVLLRVNPRQRRALTLRFGKGQTVPEIAAEMGISLPAAKNLLARGIAQARMQLEVIEDHRTCTQMQGELRDAMDSEMAGIGSAQILRAHLKHCGTCKSFVQAMRRDLHSIAVPGALATLGWRLALLHHGTHARDRLADLAHGAAGRAKLATHRVLGLGGDGSSGAGALAGTGQKVAAICGAAATTTCLATGIVGPGVGALAHHHAARPVTHAPAAKTRQLSVLAAEETEALPEPEPPSEPSPSPGEHESGAQAQPAPEPEPEPTPAEEGAEQFGFESTAPPSEAPAPEPAPAPSSPTSSSSSSGGEGEERFGFGG